MAHTGDIVALYDKEQRNVKTIPSVFRNGVQPNQIVVFNIPFEDFTTGEPTLYSQISHEQNNNRALAIRGILSVISHAVQPRDVSETGAFESRIDDSSSNVYVVLEILIGESKKPVGVRHWHFGKEGFDFGEAIRRMIIMNNTISKNRKLNQAKSKEKLTEAQISASPEIYTSIKKSQELSSRLWFPYTNRTYNNASEMGLDGRSIIHPSKILCPEYAMSQFTDRVCPEQKDLNQYYDRSTGRFKAFPIPAMASHVHSHFYSPRNIFRSALPHIMKKHYFSHFPENAAFVDDEGDMENFDDDDNENDETSRMAMTERDMALDDDVISRKEKRNDLLISLKNMTETEKKCFPADVINVSNRIIDEDSQICMAATEELQRVIDRVENSSKGALHEAQQEEEFAQINDILKFKLENFKQLEAICKKYDGGTQEYETAMKSFRTGALFEMWNSLMYSQNLAQGCVALREYYKTVPIDKQFTMNFQKVQNLSLFGNYVTFLTSVASDVHKILTNFVEFFLVRWTIMNAFQPGMEINTNLHITGAHASGKSYSVDKAKDSCWKGAACNFTTMSGHALTSTGTDYSGLSWIVHEATQEFIGDDGHGKQPPLTNVLKNVLASSIRITYEFNRDDEGARSCKTIRNRSRCTWITLDNSGKLVMNKPMMDRFFVIASKKRERSDISMFDSVFTTGWTDDPTHINEGEKKNRTLQLISFYVDLWMLAIDIGAMPPIDCTVFNIICKKMFQYFTEKGISHPGIRNCHMLQKYAMALWMEFSVYAVFFTELNVNQEATRFRPDMLLKLLPWSSISEECSIFLISLLEEKFVPKNPSKILKKFVTKFNNKNRVEGLSKFKMIPKPTTTTGTQTSGAGTPEAPDYDHRYFQINVPTVSSLCDKISYELGSEMSSEQIQSELYQLRTKYIKSYNYVLDESVNIWEANRSGPTENIPVIEIEQDPTAQKGTKATRLCIAVAFIEENYDHVMEKAIESLCHKHQREMTILTGLPYIGRHPYEPEVEIVYPNVFRTMHLKPNNETMWIPNTYNITNLQRVFIYDELEEGRVFEQDDSDPKHPVAAPVISEFEKIQTCPIIEVDDDLEKVAFIRMLENYGIPHDESSFVALPKNSMNIIWNMRDYPHMKKYQTRVIKNYPDDVIAIINGNIRGRTPSQEMKDQAAKWTGAMLKKKVLAKEEISIPRRRDIEATYLSSNPSSTPAENRPTKKSRPSYEEPRVLIIGNTNNNVASNQNTSHSNNSISSDEMSITRSSDEINVASKTAGYQPMPPDEQTMDGIQDMFKIQFQ